MYQAGDAISDRYVVEALLGEGGLARVYRVRHTQLGTVHALKHLFLTRPGLQERLLREGRIQARLQHPHVVRVQDVLDVEGQPGLLMEYVEGSSLHGVLGMRGALPLEEALDLFSQVLSGVAAAHRQGVLHRDLKPANILLSQGSTGLVAKVADFGLAKIADDPDAKGRTRAGITMGTPGYMAPEQVVSAADVDQRADIFALGVVLYEMLTGKSPFGRQDEFTTLSETVQGRYIPLQDAVEGCPEAVRAAVVKALSTEPGDRFESCEAFAASVFEGRPELLVPVQAPATPLPGLLFGAAPSLPTLADSFSLGLPVDELKGAPTAALDGSTMVPEVEAEVSGATLAPSDSVIREADAPVPAAPRSSRALLLAAVAGVGLIGLVALGLAGGGAAWLVGKGDPDDAGAAAPAVEEPGAVATSSGAEAAGGETPAAEPDVTAVVAGADDPEPTPPEATEGDGAAGSDEAETAIKEGAGRAAPDQATSTVGASPEAVEGPGAPVVGAEFVSGSVDGEADQGEPSGDGLALVEAQADAPGGEAVDPAGAREVPEAGSAVDPLSIAGSWRGEANGRPLTLRVTSQQGTKLEAEMSFLFGPTERVVALRGSVSGGGQLVLREAGGTELVFQGSASATAISGSYMQKGQKKALAWKVEKQ